MSMSIRTSPPQPAARLSRRLGLREPIYRVSVRRALTVRTDGYHFTADHWWPRHRGGTPMIAPTVLMRTPYRRFQAYDAPLIAAQGFHVLVVNCRGTFGSSGEFVGPWSYEIDDSQRVLEWLRKQRFFNGQLITWGASYLGFTQWGLAVNPPPELVAMVVKVSPHRFTDSSYPGGAVGIGTMLSWANSIVRQEERHAALYVVGGYNSDLTRLQAAAATPPIIESYQVMTGRRVPFFEDWLTHPPTDPSWLESDFSAALESVTVPVLLIGGWQDVFLKQTLAQYHRLRARGVPVHLTIGPWTHSDVRSMLGSTFTEEIDWVRDALAGRLGHAPDALADGRGKRRSRSAAVRVAVGAAPVGPQIDVAPGEPVLPVTLGRSRRRPTSTNGRRAGNKAPAAARSRIGRGMRIRIPSSSAANAGLTLSPDAGWLDIDQWPPPTARALTLRVPGAGRLEPVGSSRHWPAASALDAGDGSYTSYRYDPADPTPSVGGAALAGVVGMCDNAALEARPDVVTFTTEPLAEPLIVAGHVVADVSVQTSTGYSDIMVRLCDVRPDGASFNVCDGIVRLEGPSDPRVGADGVAHVAIGLDDTAHHFPAGHRLRMQVSSGATPRFLPNLGSGEPPATASHREAQDIQIWHDGKGTPCRLTIDVLEQSEED